MISAYNYGQILESLKDSFKTRYGENSSMKMTGLLFSPPYTRVAKEEIIDRLEYYHHRSANNIDFFCVGYGAFLPLESDSKIEPVKTVKSDLFGALTWQFDEKVFITLCEQLGLLTDWHYSGESDLILVGALYDSDVDEVNLDFSTAIVLDLELMLKEDSKLSVGRIYESIFRYVDTHSWENSTIEFSDRSGLKALLSSLVDGIIESLPKAAGLLWKKGRHYRTLNLKR